MVVKQVRRLRRDRQTPAGPRKLGNAKPPSDGLCAVTGSIWARVRAPDRIAGGLADVGRGEPGVAVRLRVAYVPGDAGCYVVASLA
jgi:hypothetical protein